MHQQFFTHAAQDLWPFIEFYDPPVDVVLDPFAGQGHLLELYEQYTSFRYSVDNDPAMKPDWVADSIEEIPEKEMLSMSNLLVLTNPPFCYRAVLKKQNVELYQKVTEAGYFDLYELCLKRVIEQLHFPPIMSIVPENFVSGRQGRLRREIYDHVAAVQVHTKNTCADTGQPTVLIYITPEKITSTDLWIDSDRVDTIVIGPDGLRPSFPRPRGLVDLGLKSGQSTAMRDAGLLLQSIDGGSEANRIRVLRVWRRFPGQRHYEGSSRDRTFVQIVPRVELTEGQIELLIERFNDWVDSWRADTYGFGLTSFRENVRGFRRKRLDWGTARMALDSMVGTIVQCGPAPGERITRFGSSTRMADS